METGSRFANILKKGPQVSHLSFSQFKLATNNTSEYDNANCSLLNWFQLVGLNAASDGIVPDWGGILKNWADYCCVKQSSCSDGTPALFSCFRKYNCLLALDTMILMWVVQDKLASTWRPSSLKVATHWIGPAELRQKGQKSNLCDQGPFPWFWMCSAACHRRQSR